MILNGVIGVILRYFPEFGSFGTDYINVVEHIPIMSGSQPYMTDGDICRGY